MDRKGRSDLVLEKAKEAKKQSGIKNRNGALLTKLDDMKCRWKEYIEEYVKDEKPKVINIESENIIDFNNIELEIIAVEIWEAMKENKTKNAAGCDGITAKMINSLNTDTIETIVQLCQKICIKK